MLPFSVGMAGPNMPIFLGNPRVPRLDYLLQSKTKNVKIFKTQLGSKSKKVAKRREVLVLYYLYLDNAFSILDLIS